MAVNRKRLEAYGLGSGLLLMPPAPIVSNRAPTTNDFARLGTEWVNKTSATVYILTTIAAGSATWQAIGGGGGAGVFASLEATTGNITADLGNIVATAGSITSAAGATLNGGNVSLAADAAAHTVTIGNTTGASTVNINAGTGGVVVNSNGQFAIGVNTPAPVASPTATVAVVTSLSQVTFTGFTTAAAGSQVFVITNAGMLATTKYLITATNTGANDAQMTITRILPAAGQVSVTLTNEGSAALNGSVIITVWILSL